MANKVKHETSSSQIVAGLYHIGFAALYLVAMVWHFRGAKEHFREASNGSGR